MKFTRGPGRIPSLKKSNMLWFFTTMFLLLVAYSLIVASRGSPLEGFAFTKGSESRAYKDDRTIYCVMVTKDDRKEFMLHSVRNFKEQDCRDKRLVIITESKQVHPTLNDDRILQIPVSRTSGVSLGALRNIAFSVIPEGAIFTVWDDDDVRSPGYLSTLKNQLGDQDFVLFTKRIEYNVNNNFAFVMELKPGFVLYFGRIYRDIRYDDVDVNEDVRLRETIKTKYKTKVLSDNDPKLYIRVVHGDNTSLLVNAKKNKVRDTSTHSVYFEHPIHEEDLQYARERIAAMNAFINQIRYQ